VIRSARRLAKLCATLVVASSLSSGCTKKDPGAIVHGKVSYKGKPVETGSVVFFPQTGPVGDGNLQPDGGYRILNREKREGIPPGSYTVVVISGQDQIALRPEDPLYRVEPAIPLKYTGKTTSPLKYEVKQGDNEINLTLDDKPSKSTQKP
jgi:hypothetical protein